MGRFAALLLVVLALAAPSWAAGPKLIDAAEAPVWRAVGRLNIAGKRFCTATLIDERVALTAAHCLFNPRTGRKVAASEMVFVAGLRLGGFAAARRVVRTALPRGYSYAEAREPRGLAADVALLELDAPIAGADVAALDVGPETRGAPVVLVSYSRKRAHAPSIERACDVVVASGALRAIDCAASAGASGSPLVAEVDGRRRVIGVVSASGARGSGPVAIAVMIEPHIDTLLAELGARR